ncbi:hypothetical protein NL676_036625 [Syzygium grande]|nr:hypothetical protein NL676_036625 [Syzygium grande]
MAVVSYNRERDELTGKYDTTIGAAAFDLLLALDGGGTLWEARSLTLAEEEEEEGMNLKQLKIARNEGILGRHDLCFDGVSEEGWVLHILFINPHELRRKGGAHL